MILYLINGSINKGDVQIIKAGKGYLTLKIKERFRNFQIWFDPNIQESLYIDASYSDFKIKRF
ncbi:MAG: hypothetical protein CM15mP102_17310 [Flavobacteriales bacterium]|nr:MAG: hypothetical protein CM15mP102_17310 [Flavobacteriales bacterium]